MDAATLATMKTETVAALTAARKAGQSYGISGRSKSSVDFAALQSDLAEINYAIALLDGTGITTALADFSKAS